MRTEIPAWLLQKSAVLPGGSASSRTHFAVKTLKSISSVIENEIYCEKFAKLPALLQLIDPRVKLCVFLAYMLLGNFISGLPALIVLAVVPVLYAKLSGLEVGRFAARTWLTVPLIVLLFSLPGGSSLFLSGKPLFFLVGSSRLLPDGLYFTQAGILMALRLAMRTGISLSFAVLLLLTTRWPRLTQALSALHLPSIFTAVLDMAYRYIFLMAETAAGMMEARCLRTVGNPKDSRRFMGHSAAHLFLKSHFLSEEVYGAMCCRCYTGNPVRSRRLKAGGQDWMFAAVNLIIILLIAGNFCIGFTK